MRLGVSSFAYRYAAAGLMAREGALAAALHILERASAAGAEVVQFCDNVPLDALSAEDLVRLAEEADGLDVALEVGTRGLALAGLRRYLGLAGQVGGRALRLVLDTADVAAIQDGLEAAAPLVRESGVLLAVENHFDVPSPVLRRIIEDVGEPAVGICLDTANSIALLERPLETAAALAPLAIQAHIKDYLVEKAPIGYHVTGRPLGEGWLDLDALAEILAPRLDALDLYVELWMDPAPGAAGDDPRNLAQEEAQVVSSLAALAAWAGR